MSKNKTSNGAAELTVNQMTSHTISLLSGIMPQVLGSAIVGSSVANPLEIEARLRSLVPLCIATVTLVHKTVVESAQL